MYMKMVGSKRAKLVETYKASVQTHDVSFDEEFWDRMCANVKEYARRMADRYGTVF